MRMRARATASGVASGTARAGASRGVGWKPRGGRFGTARDAAGGKGGVVGAIEGDGAF